MPIIGNNPRAVEQAALNRFLEELAQTGLDIDTVVMQVGGKPDAKHAEVGAIFRVHDHHRLTIMAHLLLQTAAAEMKDDTCRIARATRAALGVLNEVIGRASGPVPASTENLH